MPLCGAEWYSFPKPVRPSEFPTARKPSENDGRKQPVSPLEVSVMVLSGRTKTITRSTFGALALVSAVSLALANAPPADNPPATAAPAATVPVTAAPATTPTAAPTSAAGLAQAAGTAPAAAGDAEAVEKRLRAQGYKVEMRHGEKYFCRVTDTLGSRVTPVKACSTAEQLAVKEREAKEYVQWAQRTSTMCPSNVTTQCK